MTTSVKLIYFKLLLLLTFSNCLISQDNIIQLTADLDSSLNISNHTLVFSDTTKALSLEEIKIIREENKFVKLTNYNWLNKFKRNEFHLWYLTEIQNNSDKEIKLLYKPQWSNVQDFYVINSTKTKKYSSSLHQRQQNYDHFNEKGVIPISVAPRENISVYNKKVSVDLRTENYLFEPSFYYATKSKVLFKDYVVKGLILGGFIILFILFFTQYLFNKDIGYLAFAMSILCLTVHQIREFGVFERNLFILPEEILKFKYYLPVTLITYASHLIFVAVFLNAKKEIPLLYKFVKYCLLFMVFWFLVDRIILSIDSYLAWQLMTYLRVVYVLCSLGVIILVFQSSNILSRFVLLGSGILASTLLVVIGLSYFEISFVLFGMNISDFLNFVGIFSWLLCYGIGLGYKTRLNLLEKNKAEAELRNSKFESESLKKSSELKTNFFNQISHDFRTPLTIIKASNKKITDNITIKKIIERNSNDLISLVDQILEFNTTTKSAGDLKLDQIDVVSYLNNSLIPFCSFAEEQNKIFEVSGVKREIWLDINISGLDRILSNLIGNAFKFTNEGDTIDVKIDKVNNHLMIAVSDTGIGITKEELPHIFELYHHSNLNSNNSGYGLGLAIVQELVKRHGGSIDCKSEIKIGSKFIVKLPITNNAERVIDPKIATPDIINETAEDDSKVISIFKPNRSTVLVAEDNVDLNNLLSEILSPHYNVIKAYNGEEAYTRAKEIIPDIILSDVMMPKMNGLEFCDRVKSDAMLDHIPFLFLTARAGQDNIKAGLSKGAIGYITKPFDKEEIMIRIRNLLLTRRQLQYKYQNHIGMQKEISPSDTQIEFLTKTQNYINKNIGETNLSVENIADLHNTNHVSLNKKLKDLTGHSTAEYIRKTRLNRANQLILTSKMSITDVCYSIGLKDPSHFSKLYKAEYGVSPSQARK